MMRYATTPPSESGYYWLREGDDEEIVEVWTDPAQMEIFFIHRCGSGDAREVGSMREALWAGPIPEPDGPVDDASRLQVEPPPVTPLQ